MKNIWVILKKEYLTRVKNKTFIVMTFLAPVLIASFYGGAIYLATTGAEDNTVRKVYISSNSDIANIKKNKIDNYLFLKAPVNKDTIYNQIEREEIDAWLDIQDLHVQTLDSAKLIVKKSLSVVQLSNLNKILRDEVHTELLKLSGISQTILDSTEIKGGIKMVEIDKKGALKRSNSELKSGIGFILAMIIYMFIFIYGSMVMRSAIEEKTNRIVEVIVSSVSPFHLMMGKVLGVALVGLTQFLAWIILSFGLLFGIGQFIKPGVGKTGIPPEAMGNNADLAGAQGFDFIQQLQSLPFGQIISIFIIFFLGGYLLYSSIFAAIGAAVNQETDVQQFMLPVSLPLVFGFIIAQSVVFQSPNGNLAKIFSMIPLTSPVVMVVRIPFGVPWSEVLLSATILFATFIFMVWVSAKIYRVGILMYGKKPTWRDFYRWMKQS